jgi:hypothetical protein
MIGTRDKRVEGELAREFVRGMARTNSRLQIHFTQGEMAVLLADD